MAVTDQIFCDSCKQPITHERPASSVTSSPGQLEVWCRFCRPPGQESDEIDGDTGYDGFLEPPAWEG